MKLWLRNFLLLALMLAASGVAVALRPTHKIADQGPKVDLDAMIPRAFGDWREETQSSAQIVDPQQQATIDKIYAQTLSRTYVDSSGSRVMLSIAYARDQSDVNQVHKPEVCYPAQGFSLLNKQTGVVATSSGVIPVTRILTSLGQRHEAVTYWITVGDRVVQGGIQKKLAEMRYGIGGSIPDGLLFRVSSIDQDSPRAFELQQSFISDLLVSLAGQNRRRLAGV